MATIEQVPLALVLPLRQRVLRPHQRLDEVVLPGDSSGVHFGAFDERGAVVGVASLLSEPEPGTTAPAWRLRAMATAAEVRGTGIGAALLRAVVEQVEAEGGGVLWCAARASAIGFYERGGFEIAGEPYLVEVIGEHVTMRRLVSPSAFRTPRAGGDSVRAEG